jgi:hypothetical protein
VLTGSAARTCPHDFWNIDMELVGTCQNTIPWQHDIPQYLLPYVCGARAAPRRRSATVAEAKPVSASRRALSVSWRLTYFLGVARA